MGTTPGVLARAPGVDVQRATFPNTQENVMTHIKARRVHVLVDRGPMEKIPTTVYAHEIPCLEIQHGEGSVQELTELPEGMDYDEIGNVAKLDLDEEWSRLITKYGRHPELNVSVCEYVFQGRKDNLRKACDAPGQQAGEPEAIDADGDGNLSKAEIQARLAELDIPYHKNANKGVLLETLRDGLAQLLDEAEVPYDEQASVEVLYHLLPRGEGEV